MELPAAKLSKGYSELELELAMTDCSYQMTDYKFGILLAIGTITLVGQSVGSCRIALALYSFVTVLATGMTLAMEHCSVAKLHWCVTIFPMLPNGNWHSNSLLAPHLSL